MFVYQMDICLLLAIGWDVESDNHWQELSWLSLNVCVFLLKHSALFATKKNKHILKNKTVQLKAKQISGRKMDMGDWRSLDIPSPE